MKSIMHSWNTKPGLRNMNSLMRLTTKYFPLRDKILVQECWRREQIRKSLSRSSRSSVSKRSKGFKTSKQSRSSRGSKSSKEKELEDKIRVAKLAAEAELLEQKQIIECKAHKSSSCVSQWRCIKDDVPGFEAAISTRYWYRYF